MTLPKHVAIIMDGNGRWATQRGFSRVVGHRSGGKVVEDIVEYAGQLGLKALTLFAFSIENQGRPLSEVTFLMHLFLESLQRYTHKLHEHKVCLRIIGDRSRFENKLLQQIQYGENLTRENKGLNLTIAINYSGRWDILQASKQITEKVKQQQLQIENISEELFEQHLCLSDLPPPELLIRTSGEQRISNFMLWQFAYTELFFSPVAWPDFSRRIFDEALQFYQKRQRRFGLTPEQVVPHA